jgi:hypothetical protein
MNKIIYLILLFGLTLILGLANKNQPVLRLIKPSCIPVCKMKCAYGFVPGKNGFCKCQCKKASKVLVETNKSNF